MDDLPLALLSLVNCASLESHFTVDEVEVALNSLPNIGPDGMHDNILKVILVTS